MSYPYFLTCSKDTYSNYTVNNKPIVEYQIEEGVKYPQG